MMKNFIFYSICRDKKHLMFGLLLLSCIIFTLIIQPSTADFNYTLPIFGNANEDQNLNEEDILLIQSIIDGNSVKTELADANNDGVINDQDIEQIKKLNNGDASYIIVRDSNQKPVKISLPVNTIIPLNAMIDEQIVAIGSGGKIIGIDTQTTKDTKLFPEISKLPDVGIESEPDIEKLVSLHPDLVIDLEYADDTVMEKMKDAGLSAISLPFHGGLSDSASSTKTLGYILGNREKAIDYINWYSNYLTQIKDKIKNLDNSNKPNVFFLWSSGKNLGSSGQDSVTRDWLEFAGTNDLGGNIPGNYVNIDPEYVIEKNPEIIILDADYPSQHGFTGYQSNTTVDETSINQLIALPGFDSIDAIKNNNIYAVSNRISTYTPWLGEIYLSKIMHPELFSDIDPRSIHEEYVKRFLGINYDIYNNGLFLYPIPTDWPKSK